jgi:hypothetical protein
VTPQRSPGKGRLLRDSGTDKGERMAEIHGSVEPGFEDVRDTLSANLDSGEDVGASVAVIVDGKTVEDTAT